jgi:hypothetical protein
MSKVAVMMRWRLLKTSNPISTMFASPVINVSAFHPQAIDTSAQACMGRREAPEPDRRFKPFIYSALQCKNKAVQDSGGLCETCVTHKDAYTAAPDSKHNWHGRVDEAPELMPANSHIAGGWWFIKRRSSVFTDFKIIPNGRLMTARQEGRLDRAPVIPERELMRFARGEVPLDIEYLAERRQISASGLWTIIDTLGMNISRTVRLGSKAGMCAAIRRAMAPPAPSQHFNPEEEDYEAEVQYMAPAGDSEAGDEEAGDEEDALNTAFYEPEAQAQEQAQGGAAGGWLADEVEEAAPAPRAKPTRYIPNWDLVPVGAEVRWVVRDGERTLTSYGRHAGEGTIQFGHSLSKSLADFIKQELAAWKTLGRLPDETKAPSNAWKVLEFKKADDTWARFDTIRSAAV